MTDNPPSRLHAEQGEAMPGDGALHPALAVVSPLDDSADEAPAVDQGEYPPRRWRLRLVAFLVTCLSTFWVGASGFVPDVILSVFSSEQAAQAVRQLLYTHWREGLLYMAAVLAILGAHEMGHFLTALYYRVHASFPLFLPVPVSPIGTLGAVIAMDGSRANRRQLFDIGIAGPLAGLVVALPVLWLGIVQLDLHAPHGGPYKVGLPIIARLMLEAAHPGALAGEREWVVYASQLNPFFMAGWAGMFVTGLNMMPLSQLDGGHVLYGLSPRRARHFARGFLLFAIVFAVLARVWQNWAVMLLLITFLGVDHPPTANDRMTLGWPRTVLGLLAWIIPLLCFPIHALSNNGP